MLDMFYSHMTATHMVIDAGMPGNRAREVHDWLKHHKCSVAWPCDGKSSTIIWLSSVLVYQENVGYKTRDWLKL